MIVSIRACHWSARFIPSVAQLETSASGWIRFKLQEFPRTYTVPVRVFLKASMEFNFVDAFKGIEYPFRREVEHLDPLLVAPSRASTEYLLQTLGPDGERALFLTISKEVTLLLIAPRQVDSSYANGIGTQHDGKLKHRPANVACA